MGWNLFFMEMIRYEQTHIFVHIYSKYQLIGKITVL